MRLSEKLCDAEIEDRDVHGIGSGVRRVRMPQADVQPPHANVKPRSTRWYLDWRIVCCGAPAKIADVRS
jgi:hypothetical protein